ncbi:MAG: gamma-glutamylcyclotransferase [Nostoc sp. DedVER02]|uniref:gamma-glutamylcyclotransferase family protein n=1 Tax=unclassified Nostoc TaxID=2593658 RepID=UPI002AD25C53|nr:MULTISPECIES: gamma-glutamylcyclotransferase [unclassified Nostoc]MDZ7985890.1 gamma-glutamylcyclotransferase [Nostoc sp. DedVER02]MDZ8111551.1 gamma-glutamylcyclotransferase [Nostoc sp. DedVER01b]
MVESNKKFSDLVQVFVYGTLKPGEANYKKYCAGKVIDAKLALVQGKLFALPMGYPAMTLGDSQVYGYLVSFSSSNILNELDVLENYQPTRQASENLYNRQIIEVYEPQSLSYSWAWVYFMTLERVEQLGGFLQPDGWWSGCGLTVNC